MLDKGCCPTGDLALEHELANIRDAVCNRLLCAVSIISAPFLLINWVLSTTPELRILSSVFTACAVVICVTTLARGKLPLSLKGAAVLICFAVAGLTGLAEFGLLSYSSFLLMVSPLMACILFGPRIGLPVFALICTGIAGIAVWTVQMGHLPPQDLSGYLQSPLSWLQMLAAFIGVTGIINYSFRGLTQALIQVLAGLSDKERLLNAALRSQTLAEKQNVQSQKVALVALADLAEYRDTDTGDHVLRVARLCHDITRVLIRSGKIPAEAASSFQEHIGLASILHDVGKVSIPDSILLKPGKLTPEERHIMEGHADAGGAILHKAARLLPDSIHFRLAREIANHHHEHWDGNGYPAKLSGEVIPLSARIAAVSDVFDALTAKRPYKKPWSMEDAVAFIRERSGTQFDPAVVDAFLTVLDMRKDCPAIEWTETMTIGHPDIDHDHRVLVQLINQVASSLAADDPASVRFVLIELADYTRYHLAREEELLQDAGYPDLVKHQASHGRMIAQIQDMNRRFIEGDEAIGEELSSFLVKWLVNHIMMEDRQYRPWLVKDEKLAE